MCFAGSVDQSNPVDFDTTVQKLCETRLSCHTCEPELHTVLYIQCVDFWLLSVDSPDESQGHKM